LFEQFNTLSHIFTACENERVVFRAVDPIVGPGQFNDKGAMNKSERLRNSFHVEAIEVPHELLILLQIVLEIKEAWV
jgi:hypothetical protein